MRRITFLHARAARAARWRMIDRELAHFTACSVTALLSAAIDSPACHAWERHLVALWLRALQHPPQGPATAGPKDLGCLVAAVTRARLAGPAHYREAACDPRLAVRFPVGGSRLRLHPGDYLHAPMVLRGYAAIAAAIKPVILERRGFTLGDVLEVILRHGDRVATALSDVWPAEPEPDESTVDRGPIVTVEEIDVTVRLANGDAQTIVAACTHPQRAAAALAWLTRPASKVELATDPHQPLLGPVLAVDTASGPIFVPAALTFAAVAAAVSVLADEAGDCADARERLDLLTRYRAGSILNGLSWFPLVVNPVSRDTETEKSAAADASNEEQADQTSSRETGHAQVPGEPEVQLGDRFALIVVSVLETGELDRALWWAKSRLTEAVSSLPRTGRGAATPTKVVVYDGPALAAQSVANSVLVHVEELAELFASAEGDQLSVVAFFEELARHPGVRTVFLPDLLDAWLAWRETTVFVPPSAQGADAVRIVDLDTDLPWARAAAWEPFEPLLEQAGLPPSIGWPYAHLDGDGEASLFAPSEGTFARLRLDPPVSVMAAFKDADYFGMPRDHLAGLADGVRITLGRHHDIAEHVRLGSGAPLTLMLRLSGEPTAPGEPGMRIGFAVDARRAMVHIEMSPDVMGLFLTDPADGHRCFGLAIHHAVAELRAQRGERPGTTETAFMAAWDACPPITTIRVYESETPDLGEPAALPDGPYVTSRAVRDIAAEVVRHGAPEGTFRAQAATEVIRDFALPAIRGLLRRRIEACRPELLELAIRYLADAHVLRHQDELTIATSLSGPFADNWVEQALNATDGAEKTRPLELLTELILSYPPAGDQFVDGPLVAELGELARQLLLAASRLRNLESTLQDLAVTVLPNGMTITETVADAPGGQGAALGFDADAYLDARRAQRVAIGLAAPPLPPAPTGTVLSPARRVAQEFTPLDAVTDAALNEADRLLREDWGTGLDGLRAVLSVARTWDVGDRRCAWTDRRTLVSEAVAWSGLPVDVVETALDRLLLRGEDLRMLETVQFAELERRAHRIGLRPLAQVGDAILVAPWLAEATVGVYATYLTDGRLPHPTGAVPERVRKALERRRQAHNAELEETVRALLETAGLPHVFRLDQRMAIAARIVGLHGEIDLLIADPARARLWIVEVKDPFLAYSAATVKRRMGKFTGPDGYITTVLKKAQTIERHATAAAAACGVTSTAAWRVIPLIVTRWVDPAAFIADAKVAFTVPEHLVAVLTAAQDPQPGYAGA